MDNTFLLNRLLKSDGTNQGQRLLAALDPENIKIDDRGLKEMLNFIYGLSKDINFFNLNNVTDGDWRSFFNFFVDPVTDEITASEEDILNVLNNKSDLDPHFALFLTFLKLFQFAQKDINSITRSRLDFYYKEVLRLDNRSAVPDKVHLILELAKNLAAHKIAEGTAFKATKTGNSIPLYKADTEIVINKAAIKSLKSVFIENTGPFRVYAAGTANSKDGKGKPLTEPNPKWSAFGESQLDKTDDERNMEEVKIGFAFASPMLILKEGKRIVTLTINIRDNGHVFFTDNISNDIDIFFSGEKGWITPTSFSANITNTTLTIVASLESTDKAIVPYNKAVLKEAYETAWPVLKVMLKDGAFLYKDLYNLEVDSAKIDVTVTGVKDLVIQNDQSGLNPSKPFQPFGAIPAIDSSFYIGNAEVFQKKLSSLSLDILWNEVPASNLGNHYLSYFDGATSLANLIFTTSISLLYQDNWLKLKNPDVASGDHFLFELEDAKKPNKIPISQQTIDEAVSGHNYTRNTALQELDSFNTSSHDGFIKLDLTGPVLSEMVLVDGVMTPVVKLKAFGHAEFPNVYAKTAIKMATAGFTGQLPKAPYTPSMKTLSLNYSSSQDITITGSNDIDQFFHVEPFGVGPIDAERPYLLPQYRREVNTIDDQLTLGNFYVGVENLVPPQNLSILFQVVEGSSDTNIIVEEEDIQWSYLANNKWIPITSLQILRNTTRALQTPGIIAFAIGSDASSQHTLMPPDIYWLRGTVTKDPAGISRLTDIKAQAVQATYVLPPPDETIADKEHLDKALPPFSIKEMLVKDAAVKSVSQPYNSFDGKSEEGDTIFYTRVSERLRHKKRALALWDYERLILDEFPSIFKVKCLTHTDDHSDLAPGAVSAVVVPSLINKNAANPLQPKVNLVTTQKIKEHVDKYIPLFVDFEVSNPVYEQLLVDFKVGFMEGKDAGYYGNLLNEEIKRFLSPWAYEEGQDITFGGKVNKSDILVFIENRDYVDFVNNFQLFHIFDGVDKIGNGIGEMAIAIDFIIDGPVHPGISEMVIGDDFVVGRSVEVAYAAGPRSILVSASDHRITVLKAGEYKCEGTEYAGVGYWAIGVDFIIQ